MWMIKFIYFEKATKFCEISTVGLSCVVTVKSTVEISQNFVTLSKYMNFKERMQLFVDGIIRSAENENLMKAKLTVAAESKNENNDWY